MIRIFKLVLLLVCSQVVFGQAPSNYTNINGRYRWIAGMFDSTFHIPKGTSPSLRTGGSTNAGGLFYNTSDSSVYTYTGTQWIKARGSINPSDTTNKYVTQVYKKNGSDSVFYVKGGNHLFAFVDSVGSPGGGGGGKIYYFNGGVSMGTIGGLQMYELGDTANTGAAANFTRSTTGNIANFITDPGKPGLVQIPAGVWSVDAWLSETGGGANHAEIWIEVEKWDGSTITTIATSPIEQITEGSTPNLYSWSVSIPTTSLTVTDRIIIQFYISNTNGKTVTLYTQNGYVGEVHTTFTTGIGAINGLTAPAQYLVTGTSGTDFNISSITATHTFNLPTASATNRGALSSADWTTFNSKLSPADTVSLSNRINLKLNISDTAAMLSPYARTNVVNAGLALKVNISDTASMLTPYLRSNTAAATYVPQTRTITINGTSQDLSANRTYNVGTVTSIATNTGTGITGGTITSSGTIAADTLLLSTRAWRQKGVDSLQANINTKQNTLTLTTFGTGGVATLVGATLNIPQYQGALTNPITGTGTANYVAKFSGLTGITNSQIFDNSTNVGIGTATPDSLLTVNLGTHFKRGVRMSELPTAPGTRALRVDANGTLSVSDTLTNGISGSGTTNYIPKFTSSSAIGNSLIFDNGTNVGIGTTSPAYKLDVAGSGAFSGGLRTTAGDLRSINVGSDTPSSGSFITVVNASDSKQYLLQLNASYGLDFWNFNGSSFSKRATLTADGNLGLGVTPSAWFANTLATEIGPIALYSRTDIVNDAGLMLNAYRNASASYIYKQNGFASNYQQGNGSHYWFNAPSGTAGNAISFTQAMTLDASGNLIVGGTSANSRLHVVGSSLTNTFRVTDATNYTIVMGYEGTGNIGMMSTLGSTAKLALGTNSLARLTIDGTGNVGIGTTSNYDGFGYGSIRYLTQYNAAGTSHEIAGSTTANDTYIGSLDFINASNAGTAGSGRYGIAAIRAYTVNAGATNTGGGYMVFYTKADAGNGAERMRITSGGDVGIGTSSPIGKLDVSLLDTRRFIVTYDDAIITIKGASNTGAGENLRIIGDKLIFNTGSVGSGTEAMRITSGGDVGINTQTPNATFHVNGSIASAISIKTATYTLTSSDYTVVFDLNGNATANLPNATTCSGRIYVIKINRTNVSDVLTIDPNGAQTIDGNATYDLQCQQAITIQSDGSNWRIIGDFLGGLNCL